MTCITLFITSLHIIDQFIYSGLLCSLILLCSALLRPLLPTLVFVAISACACAPSAIFHLQDASMQIRVNKRHLMGGREGMVACMAQGGAQAVTMALPEGGYRDERGRGALLLCQLNGGAAL